MEEEAGNAVRVAVAGVAGGGDDGVAGVGVAGVGVGFSDVGCFECRRCGCPIVAGAEANLVARFHGELPELKPDVVSLIVCTDCLRPHETGYEDSPSGVTAPLRLTDGERDVLRWIAAGHVYRRPREIRVLEGPKITYEDRRVTTMAYKLYRYGCMDWVVIPECERTEHGPTAWAVTTDLGDRQLAATDPENDQEPDTVTRERKVTDRDLKGVVAAAHYGRLTRTGSGLIIERIGTWGNANAENVRRDPAGRKALEKGYVTLDEGTGVYDSTPVGRAKFGLVERAAHTPPTATEAAAA